jgi:hypothetical protein
MLENYLEIQEYRHPDLRGSQVISNDSRRVFKPKYFKPKYFKPKYFKP